MLADKPINLVAGIVGVAGPRVGARADRHAGAHRIFLDVLMQGEEIALVVDEARLEAPLPQASGAAVQRVDHAHIAPAHVLNHPPHGARSGGGHEQVHVVRHERVRVDRAAILRCALSQAFEIKAAVDVAEEARGAVVTALPDVQWDAGQL
jgi:hypothetical protein